MILKYLCTNGPCNGLLSNNIFFSNYSDQSKNHGRLREEFLGGFSVVIVVVVGGGGGGGSVFTVVPDICGGSVSTLFCIGVPSV